MRRGRWENRAGREVQEAMPDHDGIRDPVYHKGKIFVLYREANLARANLVWLRIPSWQPPAMSSCRPSPATSVSPRERAGCS